MVAQVGPAMTGRPRRYAPRERTKRPLESSLSANAPPSTPHLSPIAHEEGWYLPSPLASRLHQKSALGKPTTDGGIVLTAEEVMFAHWYRHVPLPSGDAWFSHQCSIEPRFPQRIIAMDVMRNGGERVVPAVQVSERFPSLSEQTWAIRWERAVNWMKHPGYSQVRVQHARDPVHWIELMEWVESVTNHEHIAELCVIDDEFDATVYRLSVESPSGDQMTIESLTSDEQANIRQSLNQSVSMDDGCFLSQENEYWPLPSFGVEHFSGRYLRHEEVSYLQGSGQGDNTLIFADLVQRGLILRPGFKYGCRWRAYATDVEIEHAPWLVQPTEQAPSNWEEVCLAVRLAEGVNKQWLCAIPLNERIVYLRIHRTG